jgi:hypothetical protein
MQLRSRTIQPLEKVEPKCKQQPLEKVEPKHLEQYTVDIDFDDASTVWKLNKKSTGNGTYKYICVKIAKTGKQCKNDSLRGCEYCRYHNKI